MSDDKLNKVLEDLTDIKIILTRHEIFHEANTKNLETHIKRTNLAEQRIEMLHEADLELKENIESKLEPIKRHVDMVNITVKVLGITLTALGAIIMGLYSMGILQKLF